MSDDNVSLQQKFIAEAAQMVLNLARRCKSLNADAARRTLDEAETRLAKEYELQGLAVDKAGELARQIITQARGLVFANAQTKPPTRPGTA